MRFSLLLSPLLLMLAFVGMASAQEGGKGRLSIEIVPSSLPADGKTYSVLYIQLLESEDTPSQSLESVRVFLANSNPDVATIPNEITIEPGSSYVSVPLTVSLLPGTTRITALAAGYGSANVELVTTSLWGALPPFRIVVSALPPVLPPGATGVLTIALVGVDDIPYPAPTDIPVVLTSSNPDSMELTETVVIPRASYIVKTEWEARNPGKAVVIAQANALETGSSSVEVVDIELAGEPVSLAGYSLVPSLSIKGIEQEAILLQALDENDLPVSFPCTNVFLTSSAPHVISVGPVTSSPCDSASPYIKYSLSTTSIPGETSVTAGAVGLTSATVTLSSYGLREVQLKLQFGPSIATFTDAIPTTLSLQLVDFADRPVTLHEDYTVTLLSQGVDLPSEVKIPSNESFVSIPISRESSAQGQVLVVATAQGVEGASSSIDIEQRILDISLDVPTLIAGSSGEVTAHVTANGEPIPQAQVKWKAESLSLSSEATQTDENGIARITVKAEQGKSSIDVTARASYPGYQLAVITSTISIVPVVIDEDDGSSRLPFLLAFAAVGGAFAIYIIYHLFFSKRGKASRD